MYLEARVWTVLFSELVLCPSYTFLGGLKSLVVVVVFFVYDECMFYFLLL
jgi:hypothetical protein